MILEQAFLHTLRVLFNSTCDCVGAHLEVDDIGVLPSFHQVLQLEKDVDVRRERAVLQIGEGSKELRGRLAVEP